MKLLEQFAASCRTMNFATATSDVYAYWVEDYLRFHFRRSGRWIHPNELREAGVEQFLTHLAVEGKLAASSQSQAFGAILFHHDKILDNRLERIDRLRARRKSVASGVNVGIL